MLLSIKKGLYIFLFMLLGLMLGMLAHAALEYGVLTLLLSDTERYSESWLWNHWATIHLWITIFCFLGGGASGLFFGRYFWKRLYREDGTLRPRWGASKED